MRQKSFLWVAEGPYTGTYKETPMHTTKNNYNYAKYNITQDLNRCMRRKFPVKEGILCICQTIANSQSKIS